MYGGHHHHVTDSLYHPEIRKYFAVYKGCDSYCENYYDGFLFENYDSYSDYYGGFLQNVTRGYCHYVENIDIIIWR